MNCRFIFTLFAVACFFHADAQKKKEMKFGDVSAKDFDQKTYGIDTGAQAVILYDGGIAEYKTDGSSWFNIVYTYHRKIRLLSKNAFDLATIHIPLFKDDQKTDRVDNLEAVTYNIQNGNIVKAKLDKESLFNDKITGDVTVKKFTFPNLQEGCIIEYSYTLISPVTSRLRGWTFQESYPVLKSEYEITTPTLFDFVFLNTGYYDLQPAVEQGFKSYSIAYRDKTATGHTEIYNYDATTIHAKWSLSDLPAMIKENYTSTLKNHAARVEFQLRSINFPGEDPKPVLGTWDQLVTELLKDQQFGAGLKDNNGKMGDEIKKLIIPNDSVATAKNIFGFVRDNFTCTDHDAVYLTDNLKKAFTERKGNVADINLVLTAMLLKAGISAAPVLLSTSDHGHAYELYPLIEKFNYVIAKAVINNKIYLMDASDKKIGFNRLPQYCYNGYGRTIAEEPLLVTLAPDSTREVKATTFFITNAENGKKLTGSFSSDLGYFESYDLRKEIAESNTTDFFKKIKSNYIFDVDLSDTRIDSLNNYDGSATVAYNFDIDLAGEMIYFNPLLTEGLKTNPFKSSTRSYPVEMPYAKDEMIVVNMEIPKGYKIDELPKGLILNYNGNDALFEYLLQADNTTIQLRCHLKINKTVFEPEEYESLRNFFGQIVKKETEQIVFKKN